MRNKFALSLCFAALALAACGGGGSSGGGGGAPIVPAPAPSAPSGSGSGNLPLSETVGSSAAFVDPSSHKTLYFLDVDTATGGTCTGGCLSIWPIFAPASGAQAAGNITIISRSDGSGMQFAYQGHPLYTYSGDNGRDQANGDNFPEFGGHWHVARPAAATGGTPPPSGGGGCSGPYC